MSVSSPAMVGLSLLPPSLSPVSDPRRAAKLCAGEGTASVAMNLARENLQVCKKFLRPAQIVEDARSVAEKMLEREARCSGDIPNAMERLERRHSLPRRTFWSLRYRPPKRMWADVYLQLKAAYLAECERQQKALDHEFFTTASLVGADHFLVRAAASVAGADVRAEA